MSIKIFSTFCDKNAGKVGPNLISLIPKYNSVSNIQTAFCSYQDKTNDKGNLFTPQSNAFANSVATKIAEYASLHCLHMIDP